MRLMTSGLVTKRSALLAEVEPCCQELASHVLVEKHEYGDWTRFMEWLGHLQPQLLLFDVEHFEGKVEERVRQIKASCPESMIVALHHAADPQLLIAGMRAGIDEYFYPPLQKNLRNVLERKIDQYTRDQFLTTSDRKTIGFLSAKGGCGGTTVACHTAVELGKRMHQSGTSHVLLADLDMTGGNVRFLMRSKSPYSVMDAMNAQGLDVAHWNKFISNGFPGLEVISAPHAQRLDRMPEQREVERVLNFSRARYQWTVLDLGCCLTPYTMSILESVNELYIVASPDVLSLYQVKQILNELQESNHSTDMVKIILNRSAEYEDRLVGKDAEDMLGVPTFHFLPNDYSGLSEAFSSGNLLAATSPLSREISSLASKISGIENKDSASSQKGPWYRKLRGSRN